MGVAQCLFDKTEASFELAVGTTQRGFRINLEMTCQIDHGKQQVTDLVSYSHRIVFRHGFEHFIKLFTDFIEHRQGVRPVETDLPCPLLQFCRT
ncbi:hypothetical protein D3C72_1411630 [compost metagenome]